MKLSLEAVSEYNQIHSYDNNSVVIRPQHQNRLDEIETNFILTPETLIRDWPVSDIKQLSAEQLADIQKLDPEVVLFATGSGLTVDLQKLSQILTHQHIGVEFMDLGAACRTFNLLVTEQRKVVLAVCFQSV
ncbi:Mth938-like domain-containing protein [Methylophaga sp.]|uniref:Mth938-like domain-containing protein n=1 Tax=Methylophaga sp. TaxID=2024840 RepID=UPI003F69B42C